MKTSKKALAFRKLEKRNFPSWLCNIILVIYELSLFRIWAVLFAFLLLVLRGQFFTKDGLWITLLILLFVILYLVQRWLEDETT